jgi:hypothetical protein
MHVAKFFTEPHIAVIRALELRFQPTFLDILPLYSCCWPASRSSCYSCADIS